MNALGGGRMDNLIFGQNPSGHDVCRNCYRSRSSHITLRLESPDFCGHALHGDVHCLGRLELGRMDMPSCRSLLLLPLLQYLFQRSWVGRMQNYLYTLRTLQHPMRAYSQPLLPRPLLHNRLEYKPEQVYTAASSICPCGPISLRFHSA